MKYNVFTDFHNASLLQSIILLFENRFGGQVFRPIGREWYDQGYWKVFEHPATVAQYLDIGGATPDNTRELNNSDGVAARINEETGKRYGYYRCQDIDSGYYNKAITLDTFYDINIDIVIASIPQHIEPFKNLCMSHSNRPKLIYQIGNEWTLNIEQSKLVDGVMASAKTDIGSRQKQVPYIEYHQEFDTKVFHYEEPRDIKIISSFVNCFNVDQLFRFDWELFQRIERSMPDWSFGCYGGQCRDGSKNGSRQLSDAMRESRFIWHTKNGGDGYGHIVFNSASVGRPLITKLQYYRGKLGEEVMTDEETCIAIDDLSDEEIIRKINHFNNPDVYARMTKRIHDNFLKKVNFKKESKLIAEFLENLLQ